MVKKSKSSYHFTPVHTHPKQSLLTSSELKRHDFSGLLNLAALVLFVTHLRLVIENSIKHGLLFGRFFVMLTKGEALYGWPDVVAGLVFLVCLSAAYASVFVERLWARKRVLSQPKMFRLHALLVLLSFFLPAISITLYRPQPEIGFILMVVGLLLSIKHYSFIMVHTDLRNEPENYVPEANIEHDEEEWTTEAAEAEARASSTTSGRGSGSGGKGKKLRASAAAAAALVSDSEEESNSELDSDMEEVERDLVAEHKLLHRLASLRERRRREGGLSPTTGMSPATTSKTKPTTVSSTGLRFRGTGGSGGVGGKKQQQQQPQQGWTPCVYPDNLTVGRFTYFLCLPTLCYQINYPRTRRIRWNWLGRRVFQLVFLLILSAFVTEQYILPVFEGAKEPLRRRDYLRIFERALKLSVPVCYVWLMGFVSVFHLLFNIVAELLQFSDRTFYGDWYNSSNFQHYWKTWNIPVSTFFRRHLYFPIIRLVSQQQQLGKYDSQLGATTVFFVSALLHEWVVAVPLGFFSGYCFYFMLVQLPLIYMTKGIFKKGNYWGNILFWIIFSLSISYICLYYFHMYNIAYNKY